MDGLSVFKGNDSERTVLCFCHEPPQGIASIRLLALFQGVGDHPLDPGLLNAGMLEAHTSRK